MEKNLIQVPEFFIRNILSLLLLPLLTFFLIFISYGNEFHQHLNNNPDMFSLYELSTLQKTVSKSNIPDHIESLAIDMFIYSYGLLSIWFILFAYSCYQKLSREKHSFSLIFIEFIVLILVYCFIVRTGLSVFIQILGWLFFLLLGIMIVVYVLLYSRMEHEKR